MEDLAEIFSDLVNQKKKYHEKTLSIEAEDTLVWRFLSVYDFTLDISSLLIPEFYYATMSLSLLFDFDLWELEPLNLEFEWRFPTIEEWLKGVSIVIEKLTPEELAIVFPELAVSVEEFIEANIKEEYQKSIEETRVEKCYWGVSKYGQCYVDPRPVREFIRTTVALMIKKHPSMVHRRLLLETLAKALNIDLGVARYVHDRLAMVMDAHRDCFILDYGVLDASRLCESYELDPRMGVAHYVNIDNQVVSVGFKNLADVQYGCILDVTPLDLCFLTPEEDIYKHSPEPYVASLEEKLRRFRDRLGLSPLAISNYVTGEEAADYTRCERTELWGELMGMRYTVEMIVKNFIDRNVPNLDIFTRRRYVTAVLQLIGHVGKRHKWGYRVFRIMGDEELKRWWIDYWSQQGLDRGVLEKLWSLIAPLLPAIVAKKLELGRKPRRQRPGTVIS